jgi:sugar/nucleoside kinase (ribokinase family)
MSPRVIHTAQALVDEVVQVPELPRRGGNVMASEHVLYAGGAVNILIAAARSGADCVHAGAHGIGPNGDIVRAALTAEGIALASAPIAELDTGVCFVMIEPTAERTFVTTQGAERRITPESLAPVAPAVRRSGVHQRLFVGGPHPRPAPDLAGRPACRRGGRPSIQGPPSPTCPTTSNSASWAASTSGRAISMRPAP